MTAEIAILNRGAVALAADSAVSLTGEAGRKIFDSAEKIFELSEQPPIGLMIYNNVEFKGVPLEVLIREYRSEARNKRFESILDAKDQFFEFLQKHGDHVEFAKGNFKDLLLSEIMHLNRRMMDDIPLFFSQPDQWKGKAMEFLKGREEQAKANRLNGFLAATAFEEFRRVCGEDVKELVEKRLYLLNFVDDEKFKTELFLGMTRLMFSVVRSTARSSAFTGFVFAGYGARRYVPALCAVEYDGIYFNQLRLLNKQGIGIEVGSGNRAAIVPFAQKDMPQRFINGIDDEFEQQLTGVAKGIFSEFFSGVKGVPADVAEQIVKTAMDEFGLGLNSIKDGSASKVKSVVDFMSKRELADVAHSLVELTSRKRRNSNETETVGGPIDVAILTRNEGLIWVRRRPYFDEESNPRYFKRLRRT